MTKKLEEHSRQAKELLKRGILRRHTEWQDELRALLDRPFDSEIGNEYDRSMVIVDKGRRFYKEAMRMEDYYRNSMLAIGLLNLYRGGYLTTEDIACLPDDIRAWIENY